MFDSDKSGLPFHFANYQAPMTSFGSDAKEKFSQIPYTVMNSWIGLIWLLSLLSSNSFAQSLGTVTDKEIEQGCGCSFHVPRQGKFQGTRVLHWEADGKARARLDGRLILFDVGLLPAPKPTDGPEQVGDEVVYELRSGRMRIRARCTATVVCKLSDESCEATEYNAILHVDNGRARSQIKAWAVCGC
jgi:hypothetical protein